MGTASVIVPALPSVAEGIPSGSSYIDTLLKSIKTPEQLDALQRIVNLHLDAERSKNPLAFFTPTGKQEELARAIGQYTDKWIFLFCAANSTAKTAGAISVLGNIIWGSQSKWFQGPRYDPALWKYPKKFWYVSEDSTLKDIVCGTDEISMSGIRKWFPKGRYQFSKQGQQYYSRLVTDTGWTGVFKTYDQDPSKFESDKIGIAIFNEPPPEMIFNAVLARMTMGGIIIFEMTPLFNAAWVMDRLVDAATPSSDKYVLYGDIESNCKQHGIRGLLDHKQIERIVGEYDVDELAARAHGQFMHLSGLVYKSLHQSTHRHTREPKSFSQEEYLIYNVVDPHDARPPIIGWFAVDKWENVWAVDEWPEGNFFKMKHYAGRTIDVVRAIRDKETSAGWRHDEIIRVMDPNFGRKPIQAIGRTVADHYAMCARELNFTAYWSTDVMDDLDAGHTIVKDWLVDLPEHGPKLRIGENCPNIWYSLTHYCWDPRQGRQLEKHGPGDSVQQRYKDGADLVRYLMAFIRKAPEQKKPFVPKSEFEAVHELFIKPLQARHLQRLARAQSKTRWSAL